MSKHNRMTGKSVYRGRDRIKPANWQFVIATMAMIIIPSAPTQTITPFILCNNWIGGVLIVIVYFISLFNVLRCLLLCASIEPGIILKIKSELINYERPYKVTYRTP